MEGSGTTGDVAFDMGDIPYTGLDLRTGFDLVSEEPEGEYDLIFFTLLTMMPLITTLPTPTTFLDAPRSLTIWKN